MDPQEFLKLTKEQRDAYLGSLPESQRSAFMDSVYKITTDNFAKQGIYPPTQPGATIPPSSPPMPSADATIQDPSAIVTPIQSIPKNGKVIPPLIVPQRPDPTIPSINPNIPADDPRNDPSVLAKDAALKSQTNRVMDRLSTLATVASTFTDMANLSDPSQTEIAPGAISGALGGAAAGPMGILIGGATGALKAANIRSGYDQAQEGVTKRKLATLTVAPSSMETGGIGDPEAEVSIPVQEEKGEMMLFPDGRLVEAMASKTHKQMDSKEVTDFIDPGTVVFSNSKKRLIDLSKIKDDIFTITKGDYSENGNVPGETITYGDIFGTKGKKTPAELARMVQKQTPIVEEPLEQFEVETNAEHMKRRQELLTPILQMQEGVYKKLQFEKPVKYEKGGVVMKKTKVRKYETGTGGCGVGYKKDADGNCVPDIVALANLPDDQVNSILARITYDDKDLDPSYSRIVRSSIAYQKATMNGKLDPLPGQDAPVSVQTKKGRDSVDPLNPLTAIPRTKLPPAATTAAGFTGSITTPPPSPPAVTPAATPPATTPATTPPPVVAPTPRKQVAPTPSIPMAGFKTFATNMNRIKNPVSTTPPRAKATVPGPDNFDPNLPPPKIDLPRIDDSLFSKIDASVAASQDQVDGAYTKNLADAENTYRSNRFKNFGQLATRLAGVALQDPNNEPVQLGTEFVDSMFPKVTESQIQNQVNPLRQSQNRVLSAINDSGISGANVGSAVASTQARLIEAEGDIRNKALTTNMSQDAKRYERLKSIIDLNNTAAVGAKNTTTSNQNQQIANVAKIGGDAIRDQGTLKEAIMTRRAELEKWRQENNIQISQNEFNNLATKESLRIQREYSEKMAKGFADIISRNTLQH